MQNRFSARDFVLYMLLLALLIVLLMLMYQVDRQWAKLAEMQTTLSEQARDLRTLRSGLATGSVMNQQSGKIVQKAFQRAKAATERVDYAQGDWKVESFANTLKTLTALIYKDAYAFYVQMNVLESLLIRNPETLEWEGLIAKNWNMSADGLTITFTLRDDVTFSDGQPLTAEDVAFTFDFIMNEGIDAASLRSYFDKVDSVVAKDKDTVVFTFREPYFEALKVAGVMQILPKHIYAPYLKEPQKFNESKAILFGSGPYKLASLDAWTPDQDTVELVRNERYWGDVQPSFDRLLWRIIQNDSARLTTYRNGDIDSYEATAKEYQTLKKDAQISEKSQTFEYMSPIAPYRYLGWNQLRDGKPTFFADKRVRQAMTYLTDRERIIKDVYAGYAEIAVSPFNPRSKQHDPNLQARPYDVTKAKALLAEAGFQDRNQDGVLESATGKPFEFELMYFQNDNEVKRMVLLLKDLYAQAGVKLIPSPQEWPVMLEALDKKRFDAVSIRWTSSIETDLYQIFHSSQTQANGSNVVNYKSPELDKFIEQARSTVDENQRMPLWQQAERVLFDEQPYTFLFRQKSLSFIDKRIQNLQMTATGLNDGSLPLEIYVPQAQQRYQQ